MAGESRTMLPELTEERATGELAAIYEEIRRFSGVPYVSSLQRYLATMPGALEWIWAALRPAMASGRIPETAWRLGAAARIPPAPPVSAAALRLWGVDAAGLRAIRNVAGNFVRVSPVNLVTGACVRLVLGGARPAGHASPQAPGSWTPPAPLPPMPGMADPAALAPDVRAVLMQLATEVDGAPFVPGLYRQLTRWPAFLAWLATELGPRFAAPETEAARDALRAATLAAAPAIVADLPGLPDRPMPDPATVARILAGVERYAGTSPEMVVFGRLILEALPAAM